ncbi:hypothetical protein J6R97_05455 [bacterium]|nr:hypothetical protein [bacterium]
MKKYNFLVENFKRLKVGWDFIPADHIFQFNIITEFHPALLSDFLQIKIKRGAET